ncbi:MAG: PEP-CTERM sorting domain-containing protein [Okeania sp. SIO2B3]|nr:PEP-CTERM sorting domain-containing protein [Okeania sp. SIO2B3]
MSVNNFIDSPYLDGLQTYTENGNSSFLSFNSNILDLSNNLTISAISTGEVSVDGKKIPEPTSVLSLLAIGTLGAASTLKRKLKSSKSAEKDLEKVS